MILVVGNLSWDRIIQVEELPLPNQDVLIKQVNMVPGGAAGNVAAMLALLGQKVSLLACIGDDQRGHELVKDISAYGVKTDLIRSGKAPTSEFLVIIDREGNRCFFLNPKEAAFQLTAATVQDIDLESVQHIAFVGCRLSVAQHLTNQVRDQCEKIFANIGFWISSQTLMSNNLKFLSYLDCIFANRQEFDMLSDKTKRFLTSTSFLTDSKHLVLTAGKDDTIVYTSDGPFRVEPITFERSVYTLGCGDAFMAGYISGYLRRLSQEKCCMLAHRCAAEVAILPKERNHTVDVNLSPSKG